MLINYVPVSRMDDMRSLAECQIKERKRGIALLAKADLAISFEQWNDVLEVCKIFEEILTLHIQFEEEILFVELKPSSPFGASLITGMRCEHIRLRHLLADMRRAALERDSVTFQERVFEFRNLHHEHNEQEEQVLYPLADKVLGPRAVDLWDAASYIAKG